MGSFLDMGAKIQIILCLGLGLSVLELWAGSLFPIGLGNLPCVLHSVGAICGILVLGEGCGGSVVAINIWLDLVDLGSHVCVIVGV